MQQRFGLGALDFEVVGDGPLAHAVREEIHPQFLRCGNGLPDASFKFGDFGCPQGDQIRLKNCSIGSNWAWVDDAYIPHLVKIDKGRLEVQVSSNARLLGSRVVRNILKPFDNNFDDVWRRISKRFYYRIFIPYIQLYQLSRGQTFCHASACTDGERTVLLMAWSGIGKTTSLLQLLHSSSKWKFISDDVALLTRDGQVHRTPFRMQLYPFNLVSAKQQSDLFRGRSMGDRLHWVLRQRFLGKGAVLRRVQPDEIWGADRSAMSAPLTHVLYLRRRDGISDFAHQVVSAEEIALAMAHIMQHELGPLTLLLEQSASAQFHENRFGFELNAEGAMHGVRDIVTSGLGNVQAPPMVLDVPTGASASELLSAVLARAG
ncbi:hypothetical protein KNJ79_06595 [Sphingopyxis indica]|uniref:hypothetical protein n=1 Tax=Sphingopyxis indica TaxID=436663 RepID=UPI0029391AC9|nr:hypothetical protein [Sphingopyxis indica]WOF44584.1 hypothetical protein KNJ79_06595 [Sphingopyxis indica]